MLFSKPSLLPSFLFGFQCPRCAFPRQLLHNITGFFRCQQIFSSFSKLFSDLSASGVFARSSTEVDSKSNIFRQQFQGVCKKFYTIALFSESNGAASVERKRRPVRSARVEYARASFRRRKPTRPYRQSAYAVCVEKRAPVATGTLLAYDLRRKRSSFRKGIALAISLYVSLRALSILFD